MSERAVSRVSKIRKTHTDVARAHKLQTALRETRMRLASVLVTLQAGIERLREANTLSGDTSGDTSGEACRGGPAPSYSDDLPTPAEKKPKAEAESQVQHSKEQLSRISAPT